MMQPPETLATLIDNLAAQTAADEAFVDLTRRSFLSRGVSLDDSAEPYFRILLDTFRREEATRRHRERGLANLAALQERIRLWQLRQEELLERLRSISRRLEGDRGA